MTLLPCPGEDALLHTRIEWKDSAIYRLADAGLLAVAEGEIPSEATEIVDVPLDEYPILPSDHPHFYRNHTERLRISATNKANKIKRRNITLRSWTHLYSSLARATETTCPLLYKEMKTICDLSTTHNIKGGYFNGPRGWQLVLTRLGLDGTGGNVITRTKKDQKYYDAAQQLQVSAKLKDGCKEADFAKKALAFHERIMPNLERPYTSDADAAQYIIDLLPVRLAADGRRIADKL